MGPAPLRMHSSEGSGDILVEGNHELTRRDPLPAYGRYLASAAKDVITDGYGKLKSLRAAAVDFVPSLCLGHQ